MPRSSTLDQRDSSEGNSVSPDIVQIIKHRVCISPAASSSLFVHLLLSGMLMYFLYKHTALSDQKSDCSSLRDSGELLPRKSRDVSGAAVNYEDKDCLPLLSEKTGASHCLFNLRAL